MTYSYSAAVMSGLHFYITNLVKLGIYEIKLKTSV